MLNLIFRGQYGIIRVFLRRTNCTETEDLEAAD